MSARRLEVGRLSHLRGLSSILSATADLLELVCLVTSS
jgi:hypothetical protein